MTVYRFGVDPCEIYDVTRNPVYDSYLRLRPIYPLEKVTITCISPFLSALSSHLQDSSTNIVFVFSARLFLI